MTKLVTFVAVLAAAALIVAITKGGISAPNTSHPEASAETR